MLLLPEENAGVADVSGAPNITEIDTVIKLYYLDKGVARIAGSPTPHIETLWVIAVKGTDNSTPCWFLYLFTSKDLPGWPSNIATYTGILTAQSLAQALKDAGADVVLLEYADLTTNVDFNFQTISLT